jgi:hypothetical protein
MGDMDLISFQTLRGGLQLNVAPAPQAPRAAAVERLRAVLATSGTFADVEIEATDDPDRLVAGLCTYSPDHPEADIVDTLTRAWAAELRYQGWEGHSFLVEDGHVELQAATVRADRSHFLTLHLVVQADPALVGMQRVAALPPARVQVPEQRRWLRRALDRSGV